ncbi:glycosyltransferase [Oscillatoria sp. CS-180]|uniref:glycosyltransferase family protein n=1 Tax=Oscillatoria sp. CS-180 TaxID=3021720 RepID=UPI002330E3F1|nr:glycosyltransferase [Oscillatoria sp. CS-180]MDB9527263.1 glycosyltransferase [Oscillatoria sp. CS-180]
MKLMVYSHDAFGLGNIRRMVAICDYLLKAIPSVSILVISGSPALHQLRLPEGLDYIKLPCLGRDEHGNMSVKFLRSELGDALKLRGELIRTAAANFQPDVLLVDKKPNGLWGELQPTLDYLSQQLPSTRLVLLLRDILDSPTATIAQWQRENYYTLAETLYDQVWVVGSRDIFDAPQAYQFPPALTAKTRFMGYIRRGGSLRTIADVRQSFNIAPSDQLVLVTPGGGGDGFRLVDTYLKAQSAIAPTQSIVSLIVGGPEMPSPQKRDLLQRIGQQPNLHWLEFTDDLASYMTAADVVVSMGGYNTVGEILSLRRRAIVVPRTYPVEEQWIRAQRMAELGLFSAVHPDVLTPAHLAQNLLEELQATPSTPAYQLDLNALPRITEALLNLKKSTPLVSKSELVA